MPLLDHFHPPLGTDRHWEAFHAQWSGSIAAALNAKLPQRYFAEPQVHVGSRVEVDVATFEYAGPARTAGARPMPSEPDDGGGGGLATLVAEPEVLAPPAPDASVNVAFPDAVEVLVYASDGGPTLVAAVELVSPGNKDRAEARQAFVAKCATYLRTGVGVMVIDIVTSRQANLHNELMSFLGHPGAAPLPPAGLFASAYRPSRRPPAAPAPPAESLMPAGSAASAESAEPTDRVEVWAAPFAVAGSLPRLFLPLDRRQFVPLDLEATYTEARQRSRLG